MPLKPNEVSLHAAAKHARHGKIQLWSIAVTGLHFDDMLHHGSPLYDASHGGRPQLLDRVSSDGFR